MTTRLVLDAWALLAFLQGEEPAAGRVGQLLDEAALAQVALFVSIINLGEVFYRVGKVKGEDAARTTLTELQRLSLTVVPATNDGVMAAAWLKIHHAISYADAFAAATAIAHDAVLVTGDPELQALAGHIRLEKLQRHPR